MQKKYPKKSEAAKRRIANQQRNNVGQFSAKDKATESLPPQSHLDYRSAFVSIPNPAGAGVMYNPDEAFRSSEQNAERMLFDMQVWSCLQERQLPTALAPWSIVPPDEEDQRQRYAADCLTDILYETPQLTEFFRSLLDAIFFGRVANSIDYCFKFDNGKQRMVINNWTPISGDSLLYDVTGLAGRKIGYNPNPLEAPDPNRTINTVEGRGVWIDETEKQAWIVHQFQRVAGEWRTITSAASIFGLGLRSRLYPTWLFKQELFAAIATFADKFKSGVIVGYFELGNTESQKAIYDSLLKQLNTSIMTIPRRAGGEAAEGVEILDPPDGSANILDIIDRLDKYIRLAICGQELTANTGPTGLGGNLASEQRKTFENLIRYDQLCLQDTITHQLIRVLQDWNGFGDLPPLRFEFSFDTDALAKIQKAKMLHDMGMPIPMKEMYQAAGFPIPNPGDSVTNPESLQDAPGKPMTLDDANAHATGNNSDNLPQ